ncbi:MAG TPA: low molecular weight protein-tyrosine-phosphatase [Gammaproteobacteria bacterium]|nr:low molecular weight protein-tyrosine-phosphatase [Gammaproteobacteria bacterium]
MSRFRRNPEEPEVSASGYRVLFVCMGNICRSPTAEGVFRKVWREKAPELELVLDSAGTHEYHVGEPPDARAQRAAARRGVDLSLLRARKVELGDFERFDLIVAMDQLNLETLKELCPPEYRQRLRLFLEFAPATGRSDVPDPYYGGSNGFEHVLDLAEEASMGLLEHLRVQVREAAIRKL